jgi:carboxyl-terminal processing protease
MTYPPTPPSDPEGPPIPSQPDAGRGPSVDSLGRPIADDGRASAYALPAAPVPTPVVPETARRHGTGLVIIVALIAFFGGMMTQRILIGLGSFDLGGGSASAPTPVAEATPLPHPSGDAAFALIRQSWDLLHEQYVGRAELDDQDLAHAAINAMTEAVGDEGHTVFLSPSDVQEAEDSLQGEYVGIGTIVDEGTDGIRIQGVFPDSPADKAGIGVGDEILAVDGVEIDGSNISGASERIRGAKGTTVELTIDPVGPPGPRDVTLTRENVIIPVVDWAMVPDSTIADVRLYQFSNGAIEKLQDALKAAKAAGAKSIVLDLRGNPGGFVDQAIGVASQFLATGDVFITEDADGKRTPSPRRGDGEATDLPLTILVDRSTASAAEIVASAIQEQRHVQVIGEPTFGTGTVLNRFPLDDGSALEIGVQRWLTPSGRALWHEGLIPDQQISLADGVEPVSPRDLDELGAAGLRTSKDAQLLAALEDLGWQP